MCGRYTNHTPAKIYAQIFNATLDGIETPPRFNIAPSDNVLACRVDADGKRKLVTLKWGLIPFWAKEPKIGYKMINARAETVATKPAFRAAFRHRRCLICADGFYEWKPTKHGKQPYHIRLIGGQPFAFAGLWEHWEREDQTIESCTVIVTDANELVNPIHDRMPMILSPDDYDRWLDPTNANSSELQQLLQPFPADEMESYPVGKAVNRAGLDEPRMIEPINNES